MKRFNLRWDIVGAAAALLVIVALALIRAKEGAQPEISTPSTFDFGRSGYAALYELLKREGVHVGRFEGSHLQLSGVKGALVIAQLPYDFLAGGNGLHRDDVIAIKSWVMRGGRLIVLSPPYGDEGDALLGIPASRESEHGSSHAFPFTVRPVTAAVHAVNGNFTVDFAVDAAPKALPILATRNGVVALEYPMGHGSVVALTDPSILSNARLGRDDNARFAFNLLAPAGVAFDETIHGYTRGNSLWNALPAPAHDAIYLIAAVLLLALIGNLIRFAPPLELPQTGEPDSSEYLTAMATLLEHANAARRVLTDRADFTLRTVRRALGLSDRTEFSTLLLHVERRTTRLNIAELQRLTELERPSAAQLLRAGVLCSSLQNEFGR